MTRLVLALSLAAACVFAVPTLAQQPSPRPAQQAAPAAGPNCPLALVVTASSAVQQDPLSNERLPAGNVAVLGRNVTVRLISAQLASGPVDGSTVEGAMIPDNAEDSRPNQPLIYSLWNGRGQEEFAYHLLCQYEGGAAIARRLPLRTRRCEIRVTERRPTANDATNRPVLTRADLTCRS